MERLSIRPRIDWQCQVEAQGLNFHTTDGFIYWDESTCYRFRPREIEEIATATNEIEAMCIEVVDHVIKQSRYAEFNIPESLWGLIQASWQRGDQKLYGRLDLSYNDVQPPKLLEYNADTPISLLETSLIQKHWLAQVRPGSDQFNSIHERLVAAWPQFGPGPIHLACRAQCPEYFANIAYIAETVSQAGLIPKLEIIEKILWNGHDFVDTENTVIKTLFKLYPWEWLVEDKNWRQSTLQFIEPIWKMILSNKALMVLLWELFPGHPNLLPAYFDPKKIHGDYVKKPLLGRKGQNVSFYSAHGNILSDGPFSEGPFIYQQLHCLPNFEGNYPVIGSWLIAGQAAGIGIREDKTPISNNDSRFVPHFI